MMQIFALQLRYRAMFNHDLFYKKWVLVELEISWIMPSIICYSFALTHLVLTFLVRIDYNGRSDSRHTCAHPRT